MDKDEIISKIFYDLAGYGSMKTTYEDARKIDKSIKYDDVKAWFEKNVEKKTQLRGYNSYIANEAYDEFQIDLMFFNDLKDPEYNGGLLMVDIFSKYTQVIPIQTKQVNDILEALKLGFKRMDGFPKVIYSDDEGALNSKEIQKYLKEHNISHIVTRSHANVAERQIKTIKDMIYKRIGKSDKRWVDVLYPALLTYNYKMKHSVTGMTPNDARKPKSQLEVKLNLEMHRKRSRIYPEIHVHDKVKLYKKKDKMDKQHISVWTDNSYEVEKISQSHGQNFYHVAGRERPLLRSEILLVKNV